MKRARLFGGIGLLIASVAAMGCPALDWDFQGAGGASATSTSGNGGAASSVSSSSVAMSSSSSSVASSSSGGPTSWNLYSYDMAQGKWSTVALSSVWTAKHAPPTQGILAATHLAHFNKLLVFADDGMFYLQDNGVWQPPEMTSLRFPQVVNPAALNTVYHVPSDWNQNPMMMPLMEGLNLFENPTVYVYNMLSDNSVQYVTTVLAKDEPPPGPKQATGKSLWSFEIWNKSQIGMKDGYVIWVGYDDNYVYRAPADFVWEQYKPANGPLWVGKPGAPPWSTLQAAYFVGDPNNGIGTIYFIGP